MTQVTWITEIDTALLIDRDIIGGIQWSTFIETGNDIAFTGFHIRSSDTAAAIVGSFGHNHISGGVELNPVRHSAGGSKNRGLASYGIEFPDVSCLDHSLFIASDM